jgi:hypothetical protein
VDVAVVILDDEVGHDYKILSTLRQILRSEMWTGVDQPNGNVHFITNNQPDGMTYRIPFLKITSREGNLPPTLQIALWKFNGGLISG